MKLHPDRETQDKAVVEKKMFERIMALRLSSRVYRRVQVLPSGQVLLHVFEMRSKVGDDARTHDGKHAKYYTTTRYNIVK